MTETTSTHERVHVREAWELIEVMERIGASKSAELFAPRWEASRVKGEEFYAPVASGEWFSTENRDLYQSPTTRTRFPRTVDFLRPGARNKEHSMGQGLHAPTASQAGEATC